MTEAEWFTCCDPEPMLDFRAPSQNAAKQLYRKVLILLILVVWVAR
jgi:hypothetical protein